jgi:hypothetical protein
MFAQCTSSRFANYVTSKEGKLMEGEKELRFISCNIPNLHYLEDYMPFREPNPWKLPDEFEIKDALTAIEQMGGKVTRAYVISVKKEEDRPEIIRHVEAPGVFNEKAFAVLDKALETANKTGVRVIIPFVDNWQWWGGPKEYAAFRGKKPGDFWTDTLLIADFKKTIEYVINRKNTFTGRLYKDDMAILAWETGNELKCPFKWTKEISSYIKSIDTNHLVIDGASYDKVPEEAIDFDGTDILTTHHYASPAATIKNILKNKEIINGKKPYFVGEFGFIPPKDAEAVIDTVINNELAGALIWSLRFRNSEGGFYNHYEGGNNFSYHWPGFKSGSLYGEKEIMTMIWKKAAEINKAEPTPLPVPEAPLMLTITNPYEISWRGSTGAENYIIQRKEEEENIWRNIDTVDDASVSYAPQYSDTSAKAGKTYVYRAVAVNSSGMSESSNESGPVFTACNMIVDEMAGFSKMYSHEGSLKLLAVEDVRKAKEDRNRIAGSGGVIYSTREDIFEVRANVFLTSEGEGIEIYASADGNDYEKLPLQSEFFASGKNDYGFFIPVSYTAKEIKEGVRFIKIVLSKKTQLSRTEIKFGKIKTENN